MNETTSETGHSEEKKIDINEKTNTDTENASKHM